MDSVNLIASNCCSNTFPILFDQVRVSETWKSYDQKLEALHAIASWCSFEYASLIEIWNTNDKRLEAFFIKPSRYKPLKFMG